MADDLLFGVAALAAVPSWMAVAMFAVGAVGLAALWWAR